jgi:O-antigen ligase
MTITAVDPESRTEPAPAAGRIPPAQLTITVGIALLTVAVIPGWSSSAWAPKEAVLAALAAAGLPVLVLLAIGRGPGVVRSTRTAARLALAFALVALLSALASAAPGIAMVGLYQQGTGWLFVAGVVGCWALGTRLGEKARRLLAVLIIFAAVANSAFAVLQLTVGLDRISLPLYNGGSADGLQANPFELGGIVAAALALLVGRFMNRPREWYLPVAAVTIGAGACGQRLPLLLIAAVLAWAIFRTVRPGIPRVAHDIRRALAFSTLSIAGVVTGALIARYSNSSGSISRIAGSTSEETFGQRFTAWHEGLRAFTHHFLIGAGPGQFRSVTSFLFPLSFVRADPGEVFTDAHNLFVEYLTTTGILGAGALLLWLAVVLKNARGPLVAAALVLIAMELAEPLNVAVLPVALGLLGAASPLAAFDRTGEPDVARQRDGPVPIPRIGRAIVSVATVVGLVAAALFIAGDGVMLRGQGQFDLAQDSAALSSGSTANTLLSAWPDPAELLSETHFYLSLGDHPGEQEQAIHWAEVAVSRDPTNPSLLGMLASYQLDAGKFEAAKQSSLRAEKYLPYWPVTLNDLGIASLVLGEQSEARHWFAISLEVTPQQPSIRELYDGKCKLDVHHIGLSLLSRSCSKT